MNLLDIELPVAEVGADLLQRLELQHCRLAASPLAIKAGSRAQYVAFCMKAALIKRPFATSSAEHSEGSMS